MAETMYYIASLKHTQKHHEHITFWGPNNCGYTLVVGETTGQYTRDQALKLNDGYDNIAVPVESVKALCSPEPFYRRASGQAARFYDTPGPVVDNTRANWNFLLSASLVEGRHQKPKPEVYRGARRSFALPQESANV
jgi:hypothetical protein